MSSVRRFISILAVMAATASCGRGGSKEAEEGRIRPLAYSEGDTLELDPFPSNLSAWFDFFRKRFPDFRNGNFKASGVVLHVDSLSLVPAGVQSTHPYDQVVYNLDSSYAVKIVGGGDGEIDQQVLLSSSEPPLPDRVIMFSGPNETVETADWLARDVFILSRTTVDAKKGIWSPEIYLFSLKDSTFTNFAWTRSTPVDSVMGAADEFLDSMKQRIQIKH